MKATTLAALLGSVSVIAAIGLVTTTESLAKSFQVLEQVDIGKPGIKIVDGPIDMMSFKTPTAFCILDKDDTASFLELNEATAAKLEEDGQITILMRSTDEIRNSAIDPEQVHDAIVIMTGAKAFELGHLIDESAADDTYVIYGFGVIGAKIVATFQDLDLSKIQDDLFGSVTAEIETVVAAEALKSSAGTADAVTS
jgi:hypothetical protein